MTFGMDSALYWKLSALMALEFAVWGAWYPVLAARLLGPLKFSGKQTGWIYAALPLACIFMPLLAGQMADKHVNTEYILAAAHLVGMVLLFIAGWRQDFKSLFTVILLYSLCYAATLPLVNSLMFYHLAKNNVDTAKSAYIFMWAPIAWAVAGYFLSGWRWIFKTGEQGRDCLVLAAVLSVAMAVVCGGFLPNTPPANTGGSPMQDALGMLKFPGLLPDLNGGRGDDAVLLPRDRPVHAGQPHSGQERPGFDGHCPGRPGGGDVVSARPTCRWPGL